MKQELIVNYLIVNARIKQKFLSNKQIKKNKNSVQLINLMPFKLLKSVESKSNQ